MMLKSLVFSVVKKTFCLIGILMLVGCSKPDPLMHISDDLRKGLGKQLFYTNSNEEYCFSSVYSFSDEWYERVVPIILKYGWWDQPPVELEDPAGSAMTAQEQGFEATTCNGGFKQYDDIFEEAIKNKNNYYSATDWNFMLIAKKERLLFIAISTF